MFSICVEFLQGRVAAARPDQPDRLEWPIDPARLFMALVAAHYESPSGSPNDAETLRWLETLPPPRIDAPEVHERLDSIGGDRARPCTTFVVVNDAFGNKDDPLHRGKQPRTFASGYVGDSVSRYVFDDSAEAMDDLRFESLERICSSVVRLGHSSSLVRCWVDRSVRDDTSAEENAGACATAVKRWIPETRWATEASVSNGSPVAAIDIAAPRRSMRTVTPGTLDRLDVAFNGEAIEAYDRLAIRADVKPATKASRAAMKQLKELFPGAPKVRPASREATVASRTGYRLVQSEDSMKVLHTDFDPALIVLAIDEGNVVGLESTLSLTTALRGAVLTDNDGAAPAWITGHDTDGSPTSENHLAMVPLAHVASTTRVASDRTRIRSIENRRRRNRHSTIARPNIYDGHLLGLALVLPRGLTDADRSRRLASVLYDDVGEAKPIPLTAGRVGTFTLGREERSRPPQSLDAGTWTDAGRVWASVTPIVLDRHPRVDPRKNRAAFNREVAETIRLSCGHVGVDPDEVASVFVGTHGLLSGVPSARPDRGFPLMPASGGKPTRRQVHAVIEFKRPLRGPLILGAGRFRGYGFFKPVEVQS